MQWFQWSAHWTASLNCSRDVLKDLPCLLVVAHFFVTLPFQISRNENLKVKPVEQQMTTQERICVSLVYKHWESVSEKMISNNNNNNNNNHNNNKKTERCGRNKKVDSRVLIH